MDEEDIDTVKTAYGDDYARLSALKAC